MSPTTAQRWRYLDGGISQSISILEQHTQQTVPPPGKKQWLYAYFLKVEVRSWGGAWWVYDYQKRISESHLANFCFKSKRCTRYLESLGFCHFSSLQGANQDLLIVLRWLTNRLLSAVERFDKSCSRSRGDYDQLYLRANVGVRGLARRKTIW